MKYNCIYENIISKAKQLELERIEKKKKRLQYLENHHIIPKCLGGSNDKDNLVLLTPKEHFLAHKLLVKMHPENRKLNYAYWMMCMSVSRKNEGRIRPSAREYDSVRNNLVPWNKGLTGIYSDETRKAISEGLKGTKHIRSVEYRKKHSDRQKGVPKKKVECPFCHKLGHFGKFGNLHFKYCTANPEAIKREEIKCPNCNKVGTNKHNMINYHFDNCPSINSTLTGSRLKISMTKNK